ncbi:MAG TPA: esterase-like activity of phytase family protein [Geminicoccaceae bacterium]|jgi:hypothetical protein|nr:esterase-like activity of phytase family protein [Geminicoccaceae bacterium]
MLSRPAQCCFAFALAVPSMLAGCQASSGAEAPPAVRASAFAFEPDAGEPPDFDRLEFRAGFVLTSGDARFGGLSGLWLAPDGGRLIALSDSGTLWLAEPEHAADGALTGIAGWRAVEPGMVPGDPTGRDAEALAATDGELAIAFEGAHRLRRVPRAAPESRAAPLPTPPGLSEPHNRGIEALVALDDGTLLAIAEGVRTPGGDLAAWVIDDDRALPLAYAPTAGFAPTGADRLDDTIYVLERRFSLLEGLAARVVALDAAQVRPGARLVGRELGVLRPPAISENFEGIAARRAPDGGVLLYLLSDDNFIPLLRSLLLQFSVRATPSGPATF